jgi:hypothetical protein
MRGNSLRFAVFTVAWALLASWMALPSLAQMHRGGPGVMRMYNPATEVTLKGSVESVYHMGPQGWGGTHLSLKTDQETIDVRVGPSCFLAQNKMSFAKGDKVDVTGSRVKFWNKDALIAREIKKGGETLTLRDAQGVPAWWSGGHYCGGFVD